MRTFVILACAACFGVAPVFSTPSLETVSGSEPAQGPANVQSETPSDSNNLSQKLDRSGGVIPPPRDVDPNMRVKPPPGASTGKMPVIPPPGSPGGNPNVVPK